MPKVFKTTVFVLLLVAGIALILKLQSPVSVVPPSLAEKTAASARKERPNPVELATLYDNDSSFDSPGCWEAVPRGLQTLGNIPFRIEGLIQLWGKGPAGIGRIYRESVEGISATGKFQTLYILHATSFSTEEGTPIAEVVFRYADGSSTTNAIRYGSDSRDWWQPLSEQSPLSPNPASKVVWRGDHPSLPDWVKSLRLFAIGIPNPKPESEVKGIDLISTKSGVTWVVLALTAGPSGFLKVDPKMDQDENVPDEEMTMKLTALDKNTGQAIPDMRFQITLLFGRRPRPYGIFSADEKGEVIVDLPPERIKRLSIQTISAEYPPYEMSWNTENGEKIPTNHVFKVSKKAL